MLSAAAVVPHSALSVFRQASVVCSYHTIANSFSSLRSRAANLVLGSLQPKSLLQSTHQTDFAALRVLEEHTRQLQQVMDTLQQQQGDTAPEQHVQQQQWTSQQEHFMKLAFEQARVALKLREVPIGCVVVRDGKVIGSGYNMTNHTRNATRHAELEAIDQILVDHGGDVVKADFGQCQLYVTIEPCIMCAGALSLMGFKRVYYGARNDKFGGCGSIMQVHESGCGCCGGREDGASHGQAFASQGGLFADEAIQLLQQFYVCGNPQAPKPKRTVVEVPPWELADMQQDSSKFQQQQQLEQPPQQHVAAQQQQQPSGQDGMSQSLQQQLDAPADSHTHTHVQLVLHLTQRQQQLVHRS